MSNAICSVDGCGRPVKARSWCMMHYQRWRKHNLDATKRPDVERLCSLADCDGIHLARGMCSRHYANSRYAKRPLPAHKVQLTLPDERWLPIEGHEDAYEVSDLGRVRSLPRTIMRCNGRPLQRQGMVLQGRPDTSGHIAVTLTGRVERLVHQLVMEAFVGPRPEGLEVRHLDGHHRNNQLANLEYGTHAENMRDRVRHGRQGRRAPRTMCDLGHLLVPPNLGTVRGADERPCLACARAKANERYAVSCGRTFDFPAAAARHYAEIMGENADGTQPPGGRMAS
jgi:HNH endonuclease/NUMOD4 motif